MMDQMTEGAGSTGGMGGGRSSGGGGGVAGNTGLAGTADAGAGDGRGSCGLELLMNGDFELGMTMWNEAPLGTALVRRDTDPVLVADGVTPQSGQFLLRLGGPSTAFLTHYVERYIEIPADASEITVSGYLQVRTQDTDANKHAEASIVIAVERQNPPFFTSAPTWSNLTVATSWTSFAFRVPVASMAGEQMVFRIIANLETSVATYFYFDTISVAVTGCAR